MKFYLISLLAFLFHETLAYPTGSANESVDKGSVTWTRHPLIGQGPRQEHSVVALNDDVYVIGGVGYDATSGFTTINSIEFFNVPSSTWHVAAPLPRPLNHANSAVVDGSIYVLGALDAGHSWKAVPDSYVYYPRNDSWSTLPSMPGHSARGSSAVGVYNSTIYLAGGMTLLQPFEGGHQNSNTTVSAFDTRTLTWRTDLPPLPEPRQHVGGAVVGSTFYVIGGRENGVYAYHNTTYALDLENPAAGWRTVAPMPTARGSIACAALGWRIFCVGGEGNRNNPDRIFNQTQAYDTRTDTWTKYGAMEVPRHGTGAAVVGDSIYVPGGGIHTAFLPVGITTSFRPT